MSDVLPPPLGGAEQPACPGCGAPTHAGAAFCHKCGHPLGAGLPPPLTSGPATTPAPSVFDAPPAAWPTVPPPFGQPPPAAPPRRTTLPGWGAPAQPPPAAGPAQPQSTWPYAAPAGAGGPSPYAAAAPPPRSHAGLIVLAIVGGGLVLLAVVGILAAIAIPNFVRYQLRAKASEVPALLGQLDRAEVARKADGASYVVFAEGLPGGQEAGAAKVTWGGDDAQVVSELQWPGQVATYGRYAVDGQEDEDGNQAIALCGETDLDGDGVLAAWVAFRPAQGPGGALIVPPPPAPCSGGVALEEGASLEFDPARPPGAVVKVSPDDVF